MIRLLDLYDSDGSPYDDGVAFTFQLLAERPSDASISHSKMPTFAEHVAFVSSRPYRAWYIILDAHFSGAIYATHANEIGISIAREHQRKGIATEAIALLRAKLDPLPVGRGTWLANVNPKNWRSKALFEKKFGGRIIQLTYELEGRDRGEKGG